MKGTRRSQRICIGLGAAVLSLLTAACGSGPGTGRPNERQATARAMWTERCKTSGERIHKVIEDVDGIFLMKIRDTNNFDEQFTLDDPYGHDYTNNAYILNFLRGFYHQNSQKFFPGSPPRMGYRFVEAIDPKDAVRYRYTAATKAIRKKDITAPGVQFELKRDPGYNLNVYDFVLDKTPATGPAPRYGVTYDDLSTRQEREYWIAGSSLKVVDLQTNEVIAERIGYMVDWAQGSRAGGRSPWLFAADNACPNFQRNPLQPIPRPAATAQRAQTLDFVEKVLKPNLDK